MEFNNYFDPVPKVMAHRGDSKFFPENTMPAFISAANLDVDVIETDIHITTDNQVVIWHDQSLERVSNKKGKISEYSYEELLEVDPGHNFTNDEGKTFPFRGKGLKIVEFSELLQSLPNMRFNVDLKTNSNRLVQQTIEILKKTNSLHRVCLGSFHTENIVRLRKLCPEVITSFSPAEVKRYVIQHKLGIFNFNKRFKGKSFMIPVKQGSITIVTKGFLNAVHKKGLYVHVWTINEEEEMAKLLKLGVDGIFTDDPRLLIETVSKNNL
ncbi:MAG: glycerophosphodiester phosphodiesterase [Spirochaetales bacterium]|nr:glycerophosphodiester phosphodiesterase [Spirochaetales bacterium]